MMQFKLPEWLILNSRIALLGEIYPQIRAIAIKFTPAERHLLIRYYLDRQPTAFDYESIEIVAVELDAISPSVYYERCDVECVYSTEVFSKLDGLDGLIYARREYDLEDNI